MNKNKKHSTNIKSAFTIVELLVVIVVIGILAAITIVSYTGISNKATLASIQSDLNNSSNQLKLYYTEYGSYPATLNTDYCPTAPSSTTKYCLKASSGNTYTYSVATGVTNPQSYSLTATNTSSSTFGVITNNSKSLIPNDTTAPLSPVADWLAIPTGEHYGNFYDSVTKQYASVTRAGPKTIYDPSTQKIYDVPANQLAINPRSDGKSGYEAVIEEGRTNYLTNSSFETDNNSDGLADNLSYSLNFGTKVITQSADSVYSSKSQKVQYIAVPADTGIDKYIYFTSLLPNAIAGGDSVSFSVWLKGTSNTANKPQLVAWNYKDSSSNYLGGFQNTVNITNQWQRYTLLYTAPATTNLVSFMIYIPGVTNGENFDLSMDAVQLEKGAFPTSYIPTTSTVVTRNADTVIVPTAGWNAATGTWVVIASRSSGDVQGQELLFWGSGTNNLDLGVWNTALLASSTDSANGYNNPSYSYAVPTTLGVAAMSWTTVAMTPYWNGSAFANNAGRNPTITQTAASLGWAYVGADNRWNAPIQRATVYPTALTSGEVTTVTNAIKDGP